MGLWPTPGNESRAPEPSTEKWRCLTGMKAVIHLSATRLSGEPEATTRRPEALGRRARNLALR